MSLDLTAKEAAPGRPPLWRVALLVLVALAFLAGVPYLRGVPPQLGSLLATLAFLLISLLLVTELARYPLRPLADALGLVACLGLWYAIGQSAERLTAARTLVSAASGLSFLLACVGAGRLLALIVRERNLLLPVALVAGMADVFTVFAGPTGKALEQAPKLVEKLSVAIPQIGSAAGPAGARGLTHIATAGLGDFIFLAFFLACVWRFGLRRRGTFWGILLAVATGMAAVLLLPQVPALPLLPFIVTGFLVANAGAFSLSRAEKLQMGVVLALAAGLLLVAGLLLRHH
jgi:hypothetical protein